MSKTILIADTEESTREALKLILADRFPLIVVESQVHALEILAGKNSVGMVFLGLHDESGINTEVFADIREKLPKLTIVAIGSARMEEHTLEAVRQGATGYMVKPFRADEILAMVEKTLSNK